MNKLAEELNKSLEKTVAYDLLSDFGRRIYVPKGIVVQGAEAKAKAKRFNATIGVSTENGQPMYFPSMKKWFADELTPSQIFSYAPMGGLPALRSAWKEDMLYKNPSLKDKLLSLPVVCGGLTNCLSVVTSLFINEGDSVIIPDKYWENYDLIFTEQGKANAVFFPMFNDSCFNCEGLDEAISGVKSSKVVVVLNFPNNPTGYSPTVKDADEIEKVLKKHADSGKKILLITDDAYFGLFFEDDIYKQSVFTKACNLSENILAVKCDAATKENMAWGLRVGFVTYAFKGATEEQLNALTEKTLGAVRGTVSNCSMPSQTVLLKGLQDADFIKDKQAGFDKLYRRYIALKQVLKKYESDDCLVPYPFNSGYFMSLKTKCNAEELRQLLLNKYETGVIRMEEHCIRLAFCSVAEKDIEDLVHVVYSAAKELLN